MKRCPLYACTPTNKQTTNMQANMQTNNKQQTWPSMMISTRNVFARLDPERWFDQLIVSFKMGLVYRWFDQLIVSFKMGLVYKSWTVQTKA